LKVLNLPVGETEEEKVIHVLTSGPHSLVKSWQAYDINGYIFYTKAKDSRSQCQNSGVKVDAEDSTRQQNAYYGYIDEIWKLNYGMSIQIPIFKCQWVKHPQGVEIDNYEFTIVGMRIVGHKDEPGFSLQLLHKCFTYLIPKMRRNASLFLENNELSESTMWRMRKNTTNVMRYLTLWIEEG
jgi:hypothetical protein